MHRPPAPARSTLVTAVPPADRQVPLLTGRALVLTGAALVLAGCTASAPADPHPPADPAAVTDATAATARWASAGGDDYTVTLGSRCGERGLVGDFEVTVRGDRVVTAVATDGTPVSAGVLATVPTVRELLDRLAASPDEVTAVSYDAATGAPTAVTFDPDPQGTDDEECYTLTDLRLG